MVTIIPLFSVRYVLRQSGTVAMVTGCCLCVESNGIRVTRLRAGRSEVRISAKCKRFFPPPKRPDQLGVASSLLLNWYQVCFLGMKWPGLEFNHSRPSSAKVKNKWSCTSSFPLSLWGGQGKLYLLVGRSLKILLFLIEYCWMKFLLISLSSCWTR